MSPSGRLHRIELLLQHSLSDFGDGIHEPGGFLLLCGCLSTERHSSYE
jgi:hypothetical protein